MSGLSVSSLFIGGVIPGILIGLVQMALIVWYAKRDNFRKGEWRGFGYVGKTFVEALPALIMPLIILGGILSGVFSATEAGVVACVYGTIVGFAKRNLTLKSLPTVFINAATVAATTMIVIGFAQVLSWMLTRGQFANILLNAVLGFTDNKQIVFILLLIGLFILGFFIDTTALLILAVPVVAPIIASIHIDHVHHGRLYASRGGAAVHLLRYRQDPCDEGRQGAGTVLDGYGDPGHHSVLYPRGCYVAAQFDQEVRGKQHGVQECKQKREGEVCLAAV